MIRADYAVKSCQAVLGAATIVLHERADQQVSGVGFLPISWPTSTCPQSFVRITDHMKSCQIFLFGQLKIPEKAA